ESIYVPPVVNECKDVFDIYITKNGNNYEYIYGVKQCKQETYSIALRDSGLIDQNGLINMGYGDKTGSGVKTTDKEFRIACFESSSNTICKTFNNEETSIGSSTGDENIDTLFNPSIVKVPEDGFFTYDVSYNIIAYKSVSFETYLIKGNSRKSIETNTISSSYQFEDFIAAGDYDQFCIETNDLDFGTAGKQCYEI
ncbi:hypothetical protein KY334_05165, partial [Candidatus Woesearchaeota archaeon]|nr:hypothetical protein [Candidatus Woesearchaeota archaeon]